MSKERKLHSVLEDGSEIYEYSDGALRRVDGTYFKQSPQAAPTFDKEHSALANLRKKQIQAEREETFRGEVRRTLRKKKKTATAEQAVAQMVGDLIDDAAKDGTRPSDKLSITKYTAEQAGVAHKDASTAPKITLEMTPEAVDRLYELSRGDVVEGSVRELEE